MPEMKSLRSQRSAQRYVERATQLRTMAKALPAERHRLVVFAEAYERVAAHLANTAIENEAVVETVEI